jgi:nucleoside-diphosphate-sugar epimerase
VIYISSDYVFDGAHPPYRPGDATHPLNAYGQSKLDGEHAVLQAGCDAAVLRVPLLYGDVERLDESPVTVLADALMKAAPARGSRWSTGDALSHAHGGCRRRARGMTAHRLAHPGFSGIFHWSGNEAMTKYEMACLFAPLVGADPACLVPDPARPPARAPPRRPPRHLRSGASGHRPPHGFRRGDSRHPRAAPPLICGDIGLASQPSSATLSASHVSPSLISNRPGHLYGAFIPSQRLCSVRRPRRAGHCQFQHRAW